MFFAWFSIIYVYRNFPEAILFENKANGECIKLSTDARLTSGVVDIGLTIFGTRVPKADVEILVLI